MASDVVKLIAEHDDVLRGRYRWERLVGRLLENAAGPPVELRLSIYNLGISGGSPHTYATNFQHIGVELSPDVMMCIFYEGNDFKVHEENEKEAEPSAPSMLTHPCPSTQPCRRCPWQSTPPWVSATTASSRNA